MAGQNYYMELKHYSLCRTVWFYCVAVSHRTSAETTNSPQTSWCDTQTKPENTTPNDTVLNSGYHFKLCRAFRKTSFSRILFIPLHYEPLHFPERQLWAYRTCWSWWARPGSGSSWRGGVKTGRVPHSAALARSAGLLPLVVTSGHLGFKGIFIINKQCNTPRYYGLQVNKVTDKSADLLAMLGSFRKNIARRDPW